VVKPNYYLQPSEALACFLKITRGIRSWLHNRRPPYPGLKYFIQNGVEGWEGPLSFTARFDSVRIRDSFIIRIELPTQSRSFPRVKEIGDRTNAIFAEGKVKSLADLHVNPDDRSICFCPKPEEKRRYPGTIELKRFIHDLVIPYFFALHGFEKTGKWMWGEYGHSDAGILEYYLEHRNDNDTLLLEDCLKEMNQINPAKDQLNGREKCPFCSSGLKLKKCHRKAFRGYKAIVEDIQRQKLNV
jgi:hypothetical protein